MASLTLKPRCASCGLDYAFADSGDGPAVFVILIVGFIVVGVALWMEVNYYATALAAFPALDSADHRLPRWRCAWCKGMLITLQYRHNAREGRIAVAESRLRHMGRRLPVWHRLCGADRARHPLSLGTWQMERLHWKEGLLADIAARRHCRPGAAGRDRGRGSRRGAISNTARSPRPGHYINDKERHFFATLHGRTGYYVYTPLQLADGRIFSSIAASSPSTARSRRRAQQGQLTGLQTVTGLARAQASRQAFLGSCRTTISPRTSSTGRISMPWRRARASTKGCRALLRRCRCDAKPGRLADRRRHPVRSAQQPSAICPDLVRPGRRAGRRCQRRVVRARTARRPRNSIASILFLYWARHPRR